MKGKGNDGTGNNESRDLWRTEQKLWEKLNKQYGFKFDCCANKINTKCNDYSNNFEEINLIDLVDKVCWMNPPFSNAYRMFAHYSQVVQKGICIFRCDNMETKVWQEIILKHCNWVFIPKGRVSYTPFDINIRGGMTRFPSALIGFNVEPPEDIEGTCLSINKIDLRNYNTDK